MNIKGAAIAACTITAAVCVHAAPAHAAEIPPMPQGYPIQNLYTSCTEAEAHAQGYPNWHYGQTARRYLSDGVVQFKNTTGQSVEYTAKVESQTVGPYELGPGKQGKLVWGFMMLDTDAQNVRCTQDQVWVAEGPRYTATVPESRYSELREEQAPTFG